jgi:hypothetical protein
MNHDDPGPKWLILERLTPPTTGHKHAALVDAAQVIGFDDRHWRVVATGPLSDTTGLAAACAANGIEVPAG